jgi:hypothetical protein
VCGAHHFRKAYGSAVNFLAAFAGAEDSRRSLCPNKTAFDREAGMGRADLLKKLLPTNGCGSAS